MAEEMLSLIVPDPMIAFNPFACTMKMNAIIQEIGHMDITELSVCKLKDEKIVSGQFYM